MEGSEFTVAVKYRIRELKPGCNAMSTAAPRKRTFSELYTAQQEAERLRSEAESSLDDGLRRMHEGLATATVTDIKMVRALPWLSSMLGIAVRPW